MTQLVEWAIECFNMRLDIYYPNLKTANSFTVIYLTLILKEIYIRVGLINLLLREVLVTNT